MATVISRGRELRQIVIPATTATASTRRNTIIRTKRRISDRIPRAAMRRRRRIMASVEPIAASLRALLSRVVDYAGLYPPAALPLAQTAANYQRYLASPASWMLNRLVLPA